MGQNNSIQYYEKYMWENLFKKETNTVEIETNFLKYKN